LNSAKRPADANFTYEFQAFVVVSRQAIWPCFAESTFLGTAHRGYRDYDNQSKSIKINNLDIEIQVIPWQANAPPLTVVHVQSSMAFRLQILYLVSVDFKL
jgi:hypothetical protein